MNKVLTYDLIRLIKSDAASFDNDGAGCYDNIVPPHDIVCRRTLGFSKSAVIVLTKRLNNTIYKLCTGSEWMEGSIRFLR